MSHALARFRYVVIEGPIGVGKTSLASALAANSGAELVLEKPMDNPFLERFYADPRGAALPTQLHFLFQRAQQCQQMRQADLFAPLRVSDFLLDKDRLFARLTLDDDELNLYEMVYDKLAIDAPQPDLVLYLQASVPTLIERVHKRGIPYELGIKDSYLARLCDSYARFFHNYAAAPLLIVNTDATDLVHDPDQFRALLEQIAQLRSGRHFYNPSGVLL